MDPTSLNINTPPNSQQAVNLLWKEFSSAFEESVYMIGTIALTAFAGYTLFSLAIKPMFITASALLTSRVIVKIAYPSLHTSQDGFFARKRDFELRHPNLPLAAIALQAFITLLSRPVGIVTGCLIGLYLGNSVSLNSGLFGSNGKPNLADNF